MNLEKDCVIGIVGGMGPHSGLTLFSSILSQTKASADQEHLSVLLMSFPKHIVDRTLFLDGSLRTNPAFNIVKIIKKLEDAGAKIIGIACNTSYSDEIYNIILQELQDIKSKVKLINMPAETCNYIKENHSQSRRIGLMTTNGTYKSGVYINLLTKLGYSVVVPEYKFQDEVIHRIIYDPNFGIKSHPDKVTTEVMGLLNQTMKFFKEKNTDIIILGCTDLSVIIDKINPKDMIIVDSTKVLAKALVREATKINSY